MNRFCAITVITLIATAERDALFMLVAMVTWLNSALSGIDFQLWYSCCCFLRKQLYQKTEQTYCTNQSEMIIIFYYYCHVWVYSGAAVNVHDFTVHHIWYISKKNVPSAAPYPMLVCREVCSFLQTDARPEKTKLYSSLSDFCLLVSLFFPLMCLFCSCVYRYFSILSLCDTRKHQE